MNESLRRALLRARLSEEDVAVRLEVDPKTVRRWLEGRVPYPRHRWLLASTLGLDEADLWPHVGASRSWPQEVQAIYPHLDDVPRETWLRLFRDARERIDILAGSALLFDDSEVLRILANQASAGVKERICLRDQALVARELESLGTSAKQIRDALARFGSLRQYGDVQVRVHQQLNNSIYRSDGESLATTGIYGISASRIPVIHLSHTEDDDLFEAYLKGFEDLWSSARII
jgi:transcriptional regulator with XRE-family HTH domain